MPALKSEKVGMITVLEFCMAKTTVNFPNSCKLVTMSDDDKNIDTTVEIEGPTK
jgi:hypothetical protein